MGVFRSYECSLIGTDWKSIIHATSAGKARYQYLLELREVSDDATFAHITVRSLGKLAQDKDGLDQFERIAISRGVSYAKIGMRLMVAGKEGRIVGGNSSRNFDVVFPDYAYQVNCHPTWETVYYAEDGTVLGDFRKARV